MQCNVVWHIYLVLCFCYVMPDLSVVAFPQQHAPFPGRWLEAIAAITRNFAIHDNFFKAMIPQRTKDGGSIAIKFIIIKLNSRWKKEEKKRPRGEKKKFLGDQRQQRKRKKRRCMPIQKILVRCPSPLKKKFHVTKKMKAKKEYRGIVTKLFFSLW